MNQLVFPVDTHAMSRGRMRRWGLPFALRTESIFRAGREVHG